MAHAHSRMGIEQFNDEPIPLDLDGGDQISLDSADDSIELDQGGAKGSGSTKITMFGSKKSHADKWDRTPNVTGQGAIHCKVFHCKLREDALEYLERQVNEWLDSHPEYEVKTVTSSIGEMKTKTIVEPAMFITVWV